MHAVDGEIPTQNGARWHALVDRLVHCVIHASSSHVGVVGDRIDRERRRLARDRNIKVIKVGDSTGGVWKMLQALC